MIIEIERVKGSFGPQKILRLRGEITRFGITLEPDGRFSVGMMVVIRAILPNGYRLVVVATVARVNRRSVRLRYRSLTTEERDEINKALTSYRPNDGPARRASAKVEAAA